MANYFRVIGYIVSNCDEEDDPKLLKAINDSLGASDLEIDPPSGVDFELVSRERALELGALTCHDSEWELNNG